MATTTGAPGDSGDQQDSPGLIGIIKAAIAKATESGSTGLSSVVTGLTQDLQVGGVFDRACRVMTEDDDSITKLNADLLHMAQTRPETLQLIQDIAHLVDQRVNVAKANAATLADMDAAETSGSPLPSRVPGQSDSGKHGDESWMGKY